MRCKLTGLTGLYEQKQPDHRGTRKYLEETKLKVGYWYSLKKDSLMEMKMYINFFKRPSLIKKRVLRFCICSEGIWTSNERRHFSTLSLNYVIVVVLSVKCVLIRISFKTFRCLGFLKVSWCAFIHFFDKWELRNFR